MITNGGLERMGDNADWLTWCQVGSGSTTPSETDTGLVNRIAGTNSNSQQSEQGTSPIAPYYCFRRKTFRFAEGVAAGNISEVLVGWLSTDGAYSRELIRDSLGNPTTITVLPDEVLDVTYEKRQYMPSDDVTGTITLDGVDYDFVGRAANITKNNTGIGWSIGSIGTSAGTLPSIGNQIAYNGAIGQVTEEPAGTPSAASSATAISYSASSLQRDWTLTWGISNGNLAGGISAIRTKCGIGTWQFGFTPAIPKDATKVLSLTFRHSWARA